jgi:hypothetical protein
MAVVFELLEWRGDEKVELYPFLMVPEELLELGSSALFALTAIAVLQSSASTWSAIELDGVWRHLRRARDQLRRLLPLIGSIVVVTAVLLALSLLLADAAAEPFEGLFVDVYEISGSRLSGMVSAIGVMLLVATTAICLFASRLLAAQQGKARIARFLLLSGLLTVLLAIDDHMAIHEFADDALAALSGYQAEGVVKDALEAGVLGLYAVLVTGLLWRFRATVAGSEWILLALAALLLLVSLGLDFAPHAWLAEQTGITIEAQGVVEDSLKLVGLSFYAAYFVRTSAMALRRAGD